MSNSTEETIVPTWIAAEGWSAPLYIASTPVTFDQYDLFCEKTGARKPGDHGWGRGARPVINVNVAYAVAYCQWNSNETGTLIRLPEENEWEYAAKGGSKSMGYEYSGSNVLDEVGWYIDNSLGKTHPVGQKKANELGIYDMSGNVFEWCGTSGAFRGGSWGRGNLGCRVSRRYDGRQDERNNSCGFRVLKQG